jgi:NAD(P)-dependent dehydrogenase (short-subunit alcohol dehydrogenase family)
MSVADFAPRLGSPSSGVVITGGASGIGLAAAQALAAVGRAVALWDIDKVGVEAAASHIAARYGVATLGLTVDLRDAVAIGPAAEASRAAIGRWAVWSIRPALPG